MATLGQTLKAERERRGETPSEVAALTHIKVQHIESLESDDFSRIAAAAYAKGFIRLYAEHLGLDPVPLVEEYNQRHLPQTQSTSLLPDENSPRNDREEEEEAGPSFAVQLVEFLAGVPWVRIFGVLVVLVALWFGVTATGRVAKGLLQPKESVVQSTPGNAPPHALLRPPPEPYFNPDEMGSLKP